MIRVKNKKNWKGEGEYIGRPSPLGNPYSHKESSIAELKCECRDEAVSKYREWLHEQLALDGQHKNYALADELNRLVNIARKGDLNLVCWCEPENCHGRVIKEVLEERMFVPELEGVTHINTYTKSSLKLGRDLSNLAPIPVRIDGIEFASLENYWYWVSTGETHDELIDVDPFEAKKQGRKLERVQDPLFEKKIKKAMRRKLEQHDNLRRALALSNQPITHYYHYGEKITRLPEFEWVGETWEALRVEAKATTKNRITGSAVR